MNHPLHRSRPPTTPAERARKTVRIATRNDVQWNMAVFKTPTLPSLRQLHCEIPFSANLRLKIRAIR